MSTSIYRDKITEVGVSLDASGANTAIVMAPGRRAYVRRLILVTSIAQTSALATLTVGVRNVDDTTSTTYGTFTVPLTGSALNDVAICDLATGPTTYTTAVDSSSTLAGGAMIRVKPGQEMFVTSDGGGNAGTYIIYAEYYDDAFVTADFTRRQTFTPA